MRAIYRTASFFTTWSAEILRQPAMMAALVLGPFLILLAFGSGVNITRIEPRVIVVQQNPNPDELQPVPEELDEFVEVVGVTDDIAVARRELREGNVDGVLVIPEDAVASVERNEHVPLRVLTIDFDPLRIRLTEGYLLEQVAALNHATVAKMIRDAQESFSDVDQQIATAREHIQAAQAARSDIEDVRQWVAELNAQLGPIVQVSNSLAGGVEGIAFVMPGLGIPRDDVRELRASLDRLSATVDRLDQQLDGDDEVLPTPQELQQMDEDLARIQEMGEQIQGVSPEVLSAPYELDLENIAPFVPDFAAFYAPAVLALLLQHLAVSLAALSATRIREKGLLDMLRITPARPSEVALGNYLSFATILVIVAAVLLALMMVALDVPIQGSYAIVALTILLLIVVSLGIGFVIAMIASSGRHAAQLAMLLLLASVFFSGMVISLDRIEWPVRAISYALPSTYAIRAFQDVMLLGILRSPIDLVILGAAAVVLAVLTVWLLSRRFRTA